MQLCRAQPEVPALAKPGFYSLKGDILVTGVVTEQLLPTGRLSSGSARDSLYHVRKPG